MSGDAKSIAHQLGLEGAEAPAPVPATAPPKVAPSAGEAVARGAAQGASLGFSDEAAGLGAWLADHAPGAEGATIRAAGRGVDAPIAPTTDYDVARDSERSANADARKEHPVLYTGGEIVGGAAPAALLSAGLGAAAPAVARLGTAGRAATEGALLGGATGAGASEADTAGGVAKDAAIGAGLGAGTAAGVTAAAPYVGKGLQKLGEKLEGGADTLGDIATEQKLAGAGVERAGMKKLRGKPGGLDRYAEGMDRMEIGGPLTSVRDHVEQAQAAADAAGAAKDAISTQIDAAGANVHGADVGAAIRKLKSNHGSAVGKQLEEIAQEFDSMGDVPWSQMNLERKDWGGGTAWDSGSFRAKISKKIYGAINDAMGDAAEKVQPGFGKSWRAANEDEHIALKLAELGENKLNQAGNRAMSPTDYAAGAAGTVAGGPVAGVGAAVANKVLRSREHAMASAAAGAGEAALSKLGGAADSAGAALQNVASAPAGRVGAESAGEAVAAGAASTADRALSDKIYGPMLAAHQTGDKRNLIYSTLLEKDPKFRERERERAQRDTAEKESD